ncbi:MAG: indoleacetamide hydrolase [Proteobacteria bacterium]|nr:indoleacetamide hydrolase [Pseudomonadota bacterium]
MSDPADFTVVEVVDLLRSGRLGAEEYARALLARGTAWPPLNAFIWMDPECVLAAAREADRARAAGRIGALHGLPIAVKDNIDVAGRVTTAGTPALRHHVARASAPVVAALLEAGALVFGKANMHELADGITNNNAAFGAARNPYAPDRIPGGSSGGTAVAVAARLCPAGLGTDTGGSVRIPAALCGIVGLRPSAGRYPSAGIVPISHTRDTAGPLARTVADVALLDAVIAGPPRALAAVGLRGVRIGVPRDPYFADLDRGVAAVIEAALARLSAAGCVLVEADLPGLGASYAAAGAISYYEQRRDLDAYLESAGLGLTTREVAASIASPDVRAIYQRDVLGEAAVPVNAYREAMDVHRPRLQALYRDYFRDHRVAAIALPTTVLPAQPIGADAMVELNGREVPTFATFLRNTRIMTLAGIPGLSVPAGSAPGGLPVGLELDAPEGADRELLALGLAVEATLGHLPAPAIPPR